MKFLVLWEFDLGRLEKQTVKAVLSMPDYTERLRKQNKLVARYHVVGRHGGAWIYDVDSNEELEHLLAASPVYNYARYEVLALADMDTPADVLQVGQGDDDGGGGGA